MKLVSFEINGRVSYGAVVDGKIKDLSRRFGAAYPTIVDYIREAPLQKGEALNGEADYALNEVKLLPVVPNPGKIVCIGLNYEAHKQEGVRDPNDKPMLFARWPETLIAHGDPMVVPRISEKLDFEAELYAVIGKDTGRYLPVERALETVFGYSCMNEGSVRDWQRHSSQVTAGKNFVGTGAVGPYIVTADEVGDPQALDIELRLNGAVMQKANTRDMIWSIAEMISYITNWLPLRPGDCLATGTPEGVGSRRTPPLFMKAGDVVEVEIEKVGLLRNDVVREA